MSFNQSSEYQAWNKKRIDLFESLRLLESSISLAAIVQNPLIVDTQISIGDFKDLSEYDSIIDSQIRDLERVKENVREFYKTQTPKIQLEILNERAFYDNLYHQEQNRKDD